MQQTLFEDKRYQYYEGSYPEGCACIGCCNLVSIDKPIITHSIEEIVVRYGKEYRTNVFYAREDMVSKEIIKQVRKQYGI